MFTSFRLKVPDETPHWHVNSTYVAAGQRLPYLLDHSYPRPEVPEHEMLLQPPRTVLHRRATRYRASYQLEYPGEVHHICGWYLHFIVDPPCLGDADSMLDRHVLFEVRLSEHRSALGTTYSQPITPPKRAPPPPPDTCLPPPPPPLPLDEPWGA